MNVVPDIERGTVNFKDAPKVDFVISPLMPLGDRVVAQFRIDDGFQAMTTTEAENPLLADITRGYRVSASDDTDTDTTTLQIEFGTIRRSHLFGGKQGMEIIGGVVSQALSELNELVGV